MEKEYITYYENGIISTNSKHKIVRELVEYLIESKQEAFISSKYDSESYHAGMEDMLITLLDRLNGKPIFKAERLLIAEANEA